MAEKSPMITQVGTLVYSASEELEDGIVIIFIWMRKQFRTCSKLEPKLILPLCRYCHQRAMQNIWYLKHVALEGRPIGLVPSSINKCLLMESYGLRLQLQVEETLKNSWIFYSTIAVQRNASLKKERNLEKNYQDIIFVGIKQTEWKNT